MWKNYNKICQIKEYVELDRIDKALFILPFLPLMDTVSTLVSLTFGGKEGGILAWGTYEQYGELGLVALSIFTSFVCLISVLILRLAKRKLTQEQVPKIELVILVGSVIFFFLGEAYLMGVIIQNFLVPLSLPLQTLLAVQYGVTVAYFVLVTFFTRTEMKQIIRD